MKTRTIAGLEVPACFPTQEEMDSVDSNIKVEYVREPSIGWILVTRDWTFFPIRIQQWGVNNKLDDLVPNPDPIVFARRVADYWKRKRQLRDLPQFSQEHQKE